MWTISLHDVSNAISMRSAEIKAQASMDKAIRLAGKNDDLRMAIRMAVCDANIASATRIYAKRQALSGPGWRT